MDRKAKAKKGQRNMKLMQIKNIVPLIGVILLLTTCITGRRAQEPPKPSAGPQATALDKLRAESKQPPKIRFESGIPQFVSVQVPVPSDIPDDPVIRAIDFLERYSDLYRIDNPRSQLYLERITTTESGQHIFFGQRRNEMPVFAAQLAVHINGNEIIATNGNYLTDIPVLPPPAIDEKNAETIALKHMTSEEAQRIGVPKLVYFDASLFMTQAEIDNSKMDSKTHQAWRLTVIGSGVNSWMYFIDAQNGTVLFRLNLSPTHAPQKDFNIRTANNAGETWFCGFSTPTNWFDENGPIRGATPAPDAEGNNADNFTHQVYDFFYNNFHRHSWNDNEHTVWVILDDFDWAGNAAFVSVCGHFVFGDFQATLDFLAHEVTHGVTHNSAGLIYSNQSGALNESYSDVFAAMIDNANWTIGEGITAGGFCQITNPTTGTTTPVPRCSAPRPVFTSRDMSNPPACDADCDGVGDPDDMSKFVTTTRDYGGVHTNSGIPNKAAFLIAAGGTHNGITVSGIGRTKAAKLYYEVLTTFITYNANFNSARDATVIVAQNAALAGGYNFTAADACVVLNAFAAVGLGLADIDCDGVDDNADTDDDGDTIGDSVDNCPRISNPSQTNTDNDQRGDDCENDDDGDGIPDDGDRSGIVGDKFCDTTFRSLCDDNCRLTPNHFQDDIDDDGIGDECDDSDADGVLDSVDNCLYSRNTSQNDFDNDTIGDACDVDDDNDGICDKGGPSFPGDPGAPPSGCPSSADNCPRVANSSQTDSDGDGRGDACDTCPTAADTGDTDKDGLDDACDSDDDNDGVADVTDNCPTVKNPDQRDINRNGVGQACDPDEQLKTGVRPDQIQGAIQFQREYFEKLQILILPDLDTFGRDWIPKNFFTEIKVQSEIELPIQIVDDQGFLVAQGQIGRDKVIRFYPKADFFYRPPACLPGVNCIESEDIEPYIGRQYFLEIFPTQKIKPDKPYKISIEAVSGIDMQH